jgi:putative transposase
MPGKAAKIIITERQLAALKIMIASSTCPQGVAQRARMIVLAFDGETNECIAGRIRCERHMVGVWRRRWARAFERLVLVECVEKPSALPRAIERFLSDSPRSGWAGKFSGEQVAQIIAVACEPPEKCGRPVTHWTPRELADEAKKRRIVESISVRQVGRFLKGSGTEAASKSLLAER